MTFYDHALSLTLSVSEHAVTLSELKGDKISINQKDALKLYSFEEKNIFIAWKKD